MVVSVANYVDDKDMAIALQHSFDIRNMTLDACLALPNYEYLSLKTKNKVYFFMKKRILRQLGEEV